MTDNHNTEAADKLLSLEGRAAFADFARKRFGVRSALSDRVRSDKSAWTRLRGTVNGRPFYARHDGAHKLPGDDVAALVSAWQASLDGEPAPEPEPAPAPALDLRNAPWPMAALVALASEPEPAPAPDPFCGTEDAPVRRLELDPGPAPAPKPAPEPVKPAPVFAVARPSLDPVGPNPFRGPCQRCGAVIDAGAGHRVVIGMGHGRYGTPTPRYATQCHACAPEPAGV